MKLRWMSREPAKRLTQRCEVWRFLKFCLQLILFVSHVLLLSLTPVTVRVLKPEVQTECSPAINGNAASPAHSAASASGEITGVMLRNPADTNVITIIRKQAVSCF